MISQAALRAACRPTGFVGPGCAGAARARFLRDGLRRWECGGCGRATLEPPQLRAVNIPLGNRKPAIAGTCRTFDFANNAHCCLAVVQYRFNRRFDLRAFLAPLRVALTAAPACPEHRIRATWASG